MPHQSYHLCVVQNDALVAQMEGMSHEEQQQFLAQQVTERVSLPLVQSNTQTFIRCLARSHSPVSHNGRQITACLTMQAPEMCFV